MKLYYNAYLEALDVLKYTSPLEVEPEPSKFIKPKGSKNALSESKRKELRKKRKKQ